MTLKDSKYSFRIISWQLLVLLAILYCAFLTPLNYVLRTEIISFALILDFFVSAIFTYDFYQVHHYFPKIDKKIILEDPLVEQACQSIQDSNKYLNIIYCIPFTIIAYFFIDKDSNLSFIIQLFTLIKLMRIVRIMSFLSSTKEMSLLPKSLNIIAIMIMALISIHLIACCWMWIYPNNGETDTYTFYNKSLYWTITTLTTIGYGDITPTTNAGRLFTMIIMLLGVGVYGIVIGNVSKLIVAADKHKEASKQKIIEVSEFLKHFRVPPKLQRQVYHFFHHLLKNKFSENDNQIMSELPPSLQEEIRIYMKIKLISNVPVFKNTGAGCLKMVSSKLEQIYFSPGDTIIKKGEEGQEMYIIGHGEVEVLNEEDRPFVTLKDGQFFGELALLEKTTRSNNVVCRGYCDIYKLNKKDFNEIIENFPKLKQNFQNISSERLKRKT